MVMPSRYTDNLNDGTLSVIPSIQKKLFQMDRDVQDTHFIYLRPGQIKAGNEEEIDALKDLLERRGLTWTNKPAQE